MPKPISPSLNEAVFDAGEFEDDASVRSARAALMTARIAAERSRDIAEAILANEMLTVPARHREARAKVLSLSSPAVDGIQKALTRIKTAIAETEAKLAGPPPPANAVAQMQVSEVRAALARMTPSERRLTIFKALDDPLVASAALRGPAFLAGLDPAEQADIAIRWGEAHHPGELNRLDLLRRVHEHVERGGRILIGYTAGLTDPKVIADAEKLEQAARAAEDGQVSLH